MASILTYLGPGIVGRYYLVPYLVRTACFLGATRRSKRITTVNKPLVIELPTITLSI